jgi:hypothetical protein
MNLVDLTFEARMNIIIAKIVRTDSSAIRQNLE